MISFECDYLEGAHPAVLERLSETNFMQLTGYGVDDICTEAKRKIRIACGMSEGTERDIHFLVGGTQTNQTVIASLLAPYEGVVAAETGHINVHEAGAIEYTGHKVLALPQHNGKIDSEELSEMLETFYADESYEHMVFPGMVYISHPTEYGTLYSKAELAAISAVCRKYDLPLFLDGARLGYGLMSRGTDVTLHDLVELCDVFYIGGTKVGALCGEAVVFTHGNTPKHFMTTVKQHGALLAKGRLLGLQFDALFTDGLYFEISRHAIDLAERLKEIFAAKGYRFFIDSPTNQIFIILDNEKMAQLKQEADFCFWEKYDRDNTVVRFATSWATTAEMVDKLEAIL